MNARRPATSPVTLRFAFPDDFTDVAGLAALDSSVPPEQPVLLAEVAGEVRAALSLADGSVIADPFYPTASVVDLLRARAGQLLQDADHGGRRQGLIARMRAAAAARGLALSHTDRGLARSHADRGLTRSHADRRHRSVRADRYAKKSA